MEKVREGAISECEERTLGSEQSMCKGPGAGTVPSVLEELQGSLYG